jgi:hypothetical protein
MALDKETATLLAATIAATAALSNTVISAWRQSRLEERKWQRARSDELYRWEQQRQDAADASLRTAIASLGQQLAACVQMIVWFTWKAVEAPDSLVPAEIEKYDADMKALLIPLVGAHLLVVALDPTKDAAIKPLVKAVYALDARTALATIKLNDSRKKALEELQYCFTDSEQFHERLHDQFAGILRGAHAGIAPLKTTNPGP